MGINVINNASSQEVRLATSPTGAITVGDVVVNTESGYAQTASTALTVAQNNNTTTGANSIFSSSYVKNGGYGQSSDSALPVSCQMSNGLFAYSFTGNGSSSTTGVVVSLQNLAGATVSAPIVVNSTNTICVNGVRAIPNAGFVIAFSNNSTSRLQFAIYSNTGAVVKAPTNVSSGSFTFTQQGYYNFNVLSNGNIVFVYRFSSGSYYQIFDSSGNVVLAETLIEAGVNPLGIGVTLQQSGNFVISYFRTAATSGFAFGRYSPVGVLQGSLTTLSGSGSNFLNVGNMDYICTELTNGNLVFQTCDASQRPSLYIYTSTGTLILSQPYFLGDVTYQTVSYIRSACFMPIVATSSGFLAIGAASNGNYFVLNDFNGNAITAVKNTSFNPSFQYTTSTNFSFYVLNLGNVGFALFASTQNGCGSNFVGLWCMNTNGTLIGSSVVLNTSGPLWAGYQMILTSDGSAAVSYNIPSTGATYFWTYAIQRKSIIGVAQESIAANSTGRVATAGTYSTNQNFTTGGAFNQTAATVPGARGTIVGANAILFGLT
jgi:hypothetical protein